MRKKYLSALLFGVALTAATGTFVSCKDYDDDIDNLQEQIDAQKSDLSTQLSTLDNALKEANSSAAAANTAAGNAATAAAAAQSEAEKAQQLAKQADENAKAAAAEAKAEAIKEVMAEVQELIKATDSNVSDLKQKFDELSTKISAIDQKYDTLKGTVDANEKAIKELKLQIEALKRYEQKISDNATNIGQNATDIDEVEKAVKKIQDDMKSIATTSAVKDVEKKVDGVATTVARINANLVTIAGKELRSLTLIPPFYADGIESVEYPYVLDNYLTQYKGTISGNSSENTSYRVDDQIISFPVNNEGTPFYFEPVAEVSYNMNPSSAKINSTDELTFTVKNAESYTRADVIPAVKVTGFDTKTNPGDVTVSFTAEGQKISAAKSLINIMALEVEIKGTENKADTTITSDYAALYPSLITMEAIAFSKEEQKAIDCENPTKDEIWTTAKQAIENKASLTVEYNGSLELKDYLNIHYNQSNKALGLASDTKTAGKHKILPYGDEAKYNLEYKYTLVPYTIGTETYYGAQTKESAYGYVDATGHFEPRYVDSNGNSIKSDGTSGVSSIGKQPLVRVEVVDKTSGKTVLGGFIKIKIVRTITPKEAAAMDLGKVSYTCNYADKYVTWAQMSSNLLELAAVSSKAEFEQLYSLETAYGNTYAGPDGQSNDYYAIVYAKDKDGKYNPLAENYKYGYIEEYGHLQGEANDRLRWTLYGQWYRDNIFKDFKVDDLTAKATVYVCYKPKDALSEGTLPKIYVPLTLTVVKPAADYGTKNKNYWFADSKNTALGAQRLNVAYPKNNGNTEDYTVDLDNAFEGNIIKYTITNNQDKVFDNDWAKAGYVMYTYYFTADNAGRTYKVDNVTYTLSLDANEAPYYRTLYANNQVIATIDQSSYYYDNGVLTRNGNNGNVQYAGTTAPWANDVAKKLLNAWTHDDATSGHNYFANVGIRAYNDCGITLGTWKFESRFLRPIDVNGVKNGQFVDAEANGSVVNVADLFEFIDWRDVKFTGSNAWLFAYYDVKSVKVDIANITTNMNGHDINTKKLKDVTSQVIFTHVDANGTISTVNSVSTKSFDLSEYNTASATPANVLEAVKAALGQIKYENNGNNVKEFLVRIPIEIGYEWGSIKSYVDCKVVSTQGNNNPDQQ